MKLSSLHYVHYVQYVIMCALREEVWAGLRVLGLEVPEEAAGAQVESAGIARLVIAKQPGPDGRPGSTPGALQGVQ